MENQQYRVNDDGEPSGTAGKPIYGQIQAFGLTNILILVVRYFGGTLLGTSGLINAYREAARDCLDHATLTEVLVFNRAKVQYPYEQMNSVMRIIKEEGVTIEQQNLENVCLLVLRIKRSGYQLITERLERLEGVRVTGI